MILSIHFMDQKVIVLFIIQIVLDFACNPKISCDENAFVDNWPTYGTKLRTLVKSDVATDWDQDVENLLLLLHVFPAKSVKLPFLNAIKKLIVFRVVSVACEKCLVMHYFIHFRTIM